MEGTALYDFNATSPDELSFKKNEELVILSLNNEDGSWFKGRIGNKSGLVPSNYIKLRPHKWYIEEFSRIDAINLLLEIRKGGEFVQQSGAFIIRPSDSEAPFALSVKVGRDVQHLKIKKDGNGSYSIWDKTFSSLNALVADYHRNSVLKSTQVSLKEVVMASVVAKFDLDATGPEYLSFKRGDTITVLQCMDQEWWLGYVEKPSGASRGLFPTTYVNKTT